MGTVCIHVGALVTNIDTGAVSNETVTVNLNGTPDQLANGLIAGTIVNTTSGSLACMADVGVLGTSTKMISCVGQSPGDNQKCSTSCLFPRAVRSGLKQ